MADTFDRQGFATPAQPQPFAMFEVTTLPEEERAASKSAHQREALALVDKA